MMIHGHVPHRFRADAVLTACYLINHMSSSVLDGAIPFIVLFLFAPLFPVSPKIFGYVCYVYDNCPSRTKLDPKSMQCIFLGYSGTQKGYRCYSPTFRRYFISSYVNFMEYVPYLLTSESSQLFITGKSPPIMSILKYSDVHIGSSSILESGMSLTPLVPPITRVYTRRGKNLPVDINSVQTIHDHETCGSPIEPDPTTQSAAPASNPPPISNLDLPIALRKVSRTCPSTRYPLDRFYSYAALSTHHRAFTMSLDSYSVPKNVSEALHNPGWFSAMQEEMSALWKNKTWDLYPLPLGKKAVGYKWIFTIKVHPDGSLH
jgi:hypothetical protein